jgi:hypothetical protein
MTPEAAQSLERQVRLAEVSLAAAAMGRGAWHGNGGWASLPWSARREIAERGLADLPRQPV